MLLMLLSVFTGVDLLLILIMEFNCKKGRVFISTISLHKQDYPECRALLSSIYRYLASDDFRPAQDISYEEVTTWSLL